ncbi:MAG: Fe(3+) ABC transporter substrate-binding protein [Deltaproteobacteria bacterium]|nr:MAG: Fe(3+) ABC transporter substrate-binding protein [Deltaproteobacteria bacterium]
MKKFSVWILFVFIGVVFVTMNAWGDEKELNIYSSRHYDTDKQVYADFEEATGIKVNVLEGKGGQLLERLSREKSNPKADLFLTVGAENIYFLKKNHLLERFDSYVVKKNIPEKYRGDGWMGITSRARIIAYSKARVNPDMINTYESLTEPEWKGKVLVRSSNSSYNQALLASFIELYGNTKSRQWAKGIVKNMARRPKGNDRDQAKAIVAGVGDLAIMNSYYFIKMLRSSDPAEVAVTNQIGLIFPEKTHLNLSIAALIKGSKNKENAVRFLESLSGKKVQKIYVEGNGEFPLNPEVSKSEVQKSWGEFTTQDLNFTDLGKFRKRAVIIFDQAGWK